MQTDIRLETRIEQSADSLAVSYSLLNSTPKPLLLFDRMWDRKTGALNPNWAYVEIRGGRALIKRIMEPVPDSLDVNNPERPHAREIAPGAKAEGKFVLSLPLTERGAYDQFTHASKEFDETAVTAAGFVLGWAEKPDNLSPAYKPVELNGEKLLLLSDGLIASIQRTATGEPAHISAAAKTKR